jgi:hypothetical protein
MYAQAIDALEFDKAEINDGITIFIVVLFCQFELLRRLDTFSFIETDCGLTVNKETKRLRSVRWRRTTQGEGEDFAMLVELESAPCKRSN